MTLYDRLGVPATATHAELRAAYRRGARDLHPDRAGPDVTGAMAELNEAWQVLSDPAARRAYDATLAGGVPPGARPTGGATGPTRVDDPDPVDLDRWDLDDRFGSEVEDPRERILRWMVVVIGLVVVVGLVALFAYAFTASPQVVGEG